jgi:hypothetical protein
MACSDCPPSHPTWLVCSNPTCNAQYDDYAGMFHSRLCPKCAKARELQLRAHTAANGRFAGVRTNAPKA